MIFCFFLWYLVAMILSYFAPCIRFSTLSHCWSAPVHYSAGHFKPPFDIRFILLGCCSVGHLCRDSVQHWPQSPICMWIIRWRLHGNHKSSFPGIDSKPHLFLTFSTQPARHIYPMFDQCWPTVYDVGPTLVKHWVDVSCFLGISRQLNIILLLLFYPLLCGL